MDELPDSERILSRFNRLMHDLLRARPGRTCFERWEVELMLDLQACELPRARRKEMLRRYQKAVERQLERGPGPPLKLSEFLARREPKGGAAPASRSA